MAHTRRGGGRGWRAEAVAGLYTLARAMAIAFAVLLVLAAALLAAGNEADANQLAVYAYYALASAVASLLAAEVLGGPEEAQQG